MDGITQLVTVARAYADAEKLDLTTVSWRLFGDSKKLRHLTQGRDIQVRRHEQAMRWLSSNWPSDADWPADIARPPSEGSTVDASSGHGAVNPDANISRTEVAS